MRRRCHLLHCLIHAYPPRQKIRANNAKGGTSRKARPERHVHSTARQRRDLLRGEYGGVPCKRFLHSLPASSYGLRRDNPLGRNDRGVGWSLPVRRSCKLACGGGAIYRIVWARLINLPTSLGQTMRWVAPPGKNAERHVHSTARKRRDLVRGGNGSLPCKRFLHSLPASSYGLRRDNPLGRNDRGGGGFVRMPI